FCHDAGIIFQDGLDKICVSSVAKSPRMEYEAVIGMEAHVQLKIKPKMDAVVLAKTVSPAENRIYRATAVKNHGQQKKCRSVTQLTMTGLFRSGHEQAASRRGRPRATRFDRSGG